MFNALKNGESLTWAFILTPIAAPKTKSVDTFWLLLVPSISAKKYTRLIESGYVDWIKVRGFVTLTVKLWIGSGSQNYLKNLPVTESIVALEIYPYISNGSFFPTSFANCWANISLSCTKWGTNEVKMLWLNPVITNFLFFFHLCPVKKKNKKLTHRP